MKFDSPMSVRYQLQGLLVEQDADNFIRFDFYSEGTSTKLFAARFAGGSPSIQYNGTVTGAGVSPMWMRVSRSGDVWTQSWSEDGVTWSPGASFTYALQVSSVGLFVGNAGYNPAHTATVDYFHNTAAP